MRTVRELSVLGHISVRTLHHYDAVGVLKPAALSPAGYRLYDDAAVARLQRILLYRDLGFSLAQISKLLEAPDAERNQRLKERIEELERQKDHLAKMISRARRLVDEGREDMNIPTDAYTREAKEKWGTTAAYLEYEEKAKSRSQAESELAAARLMDIFGEIGSLRSLSPEDPAVQEQIDALKTFINENYYSVDNEILMGLGIMYEEDDRFRQNIDARGGAGTAQFARKAICCHCRR